MRKICPESQKWRVMSEVLIFQDMYPSEFIYHSFLMDWPMHGVPLSYIDILSICNNIQYIVFLSSISDNVSTFIFGKKTVFYFVLNRSPYP